MLCKEDFMDVFVKIREQCVSLLDGEDCFLIFETNRSILEFDGRSIYPSTRARRGVLRDSLCRGEPVYQAKASMAHAMHGGITTDIRVRLVP